jgi:hypothetical protein
MECDYTAIPDGYVEVIGPSGQHFLVPQFFAPALQITMDGMKEKRDLNIEKAAGTVRIFYYRLHFPGPPTFTFTAHRPLLVD